jgi:hypothetical protein
MNFIGKRHIILQGYTQKVPKLNGPKFIITMYMQYSSVHHNIAC